MMMEGLRRWAGNVVLDFRRSSVSVYGVKSDVSHLPTTAAAVISADSKTEHHPADAIFLPLNPQSNFRHTFVKHNYLIR
jgi:hypothetical protein